MLWSIYYSAYYQIVEKIRKNVHISKILYQLEIQSSEAWSMEKGSRHRSWVSQTAEMLVAFDEGRGQMKSKLSFFPFFNLQYLKFVIFSRNRQPIKVKVKYVRGKFYVIIYRINQWCPAAPWIFLIVFGSWDIWKNRRTLSSLKIKPEQWARFFQFFEQTTEPIFLKLFRYIELRGPGKKLLDVFRYV